ncbi:hypothetical protein BDW62DRAFT_148076 [Aspergillus aurantiobrunneus]
MDPSQQTTPSTNSRVHCFSSSAGPFLGLLQSETGVLLANGSRFVVRLGAKFHGPREQNNPEIGERRPTNLTECYHGMNQESQVRFQRASKLLQWVERVTITITTYQRSLPKSTTASRLVAVGISIRESCASRTLMINHSYMNDRLYWVVYGANVHLLTKR